MAEKAKTDNIKTDIKTNIKTDTKVSIKMDSNFKHIVRIANVDVPGTKQIRLALTNIKGIGLNFADVVCKAANVAQNAVTGNLTPEEVLRLNKVIDNPHANGIPSWLYNRRKDYESGENKHVVTGTLNFMQDNDIKRSKKIKTLIGIRHQLGLPVRGQRTRAHFRKHKGKVVGVSKKKIAPAASGDKKSEKKEKGGEKK